MGFVKTEILVDAGQLKKIDFYIKCRVFKNRSHVFQFALTKMLDRLKHARLVRECAKLDVHLEQELADLGLSKN